jgi:hypothetical protein
VPDNIGLLGLLCIMASGVIISVRGRKVAVPA